MIDMLRDFVYGSLRTDRALSIIPNIKRLITKAREVGIPVIYANDAHLPEADHEFKVWGPHAIKGTEGAKLTSSLPLGWFIGLWFTAFILIASLLVGLTHPAPLVQR